MGETSVDLLFLVPLKRKNSLSPLQMPAADYRTKIIILRLVLRSEKRTPVLRSSPLPGSFFLAGDRSELTDGAMKEGNLEDWR